MQSSYVTIYVYADLRLKYYPSIYFNNNVEINSLLCV